MRRFFSCLKHRRKAQRPEVWEQVEPTLETCREFFDIVHNLPQLDDDAPRPQIVAGPTGRVIWSVPVAGGTPAYMCADRSNFCNEDRFIVHVKMREFYATWRVVELTKGEEYSHYCPPALGGITEHRKWGTQAESWSAGVKNPVPLADIYYRSDLGISFSNGITRTLWLAHNKAPSFPVEVRGRETAIALHEALGDPLTPIRSVDELTR